MGKFILGEEGNFKSGYITFINNQSRWVCENCYKDFREKYGFYE